MLTVRHNRKKYEMRLPHLVFLDDQPVAAMQGDELRIQLPTGSYRLRVQFGGQVPLGKSGRRIDLSLSSTAEVTLSHRGDTVVEFHDRERLWNIIFDLDLVLWIVSLFVTLPPLYKILSDAFFAVWLARLILIRKRYYKLTVL